MSDYFNEGFTVFYRKIIKWEWYKKDGMLRLFFHLIVTANHKDAKWEGRIIKRGQLVTGRNALSKATGLSQRRIRTILVRLEETGEITRKSTNQNSLITIVNYDEYQTKKDRTDQRPTSDRPATDQRPTTNNNVNNVNNVKEEEGKRARTAPSPPRKKPAEKADKNSTITDLSFDLKKVDFSRIDLSWLDPAIKSETLKDFFDYRLTKSDNLTLRVLKNSCSQAMRAKKLYGIDPNEAFDYSMGKGWKAVSASYLKNCVMDFEIINGAENVPEDTSSNQSLSRASPRMTPRQQYMAEAAVAILNSRRTHEKPTDPNETNTGNGTELSVVPDSSLP